MRLDKRESVLVRDSNWILVRELVFGIGECLLRTTLFVCHHCSSSEHILAHSGIFSRLIAHGIGLHPYISRTM